MTLSPIPYEAIIKWLPDFHSKSHNQDPLPNNAELIGIFEGEYFIGYFIVTGSSDGDLEINHGYLCKEARHKKAYRLAMCLLEQQAKRIGYKRILLASSRSLKAYIKFMAEMNYKPERIIFSKVV